MKELIACCGLDCEKCDARIATINRDDALREKTAKLWTELNHAEIPAEILYCSGCRTEGVKFPYCDSMCPIRQCALKKQIGTCGDCPELETCGKIAPIFSSHAEARENLHEAL